MGRQHISIPAGALQKAEVEVHISEDDDGERSYRYRVNLVTTTEDLPFPAYFFTEDEEYVRAQAQEINAFLTNPEQPSLTFRQDDRVLVYTVGIMSIVIGIGILFWVLR